jgi:hypothetical protein
MLPPGFQPRHTGTHWVGGANSAQMHPSQVAFAQDMMGFSSRCHTEANGLMCHVNQALRAGAHPEDVAGMQLISHEMRTLAIGMQSCANRLQQRLVSPVEYQAICEHANFMLCRANEMSLQARQQALALKPSHPPLQNLHSQHRQNLSGFLQNNPSTGRKIESVSRIGSSPLTGVKFTQVKPMNPNYQGEETGAVWGTSVAYLNRDQRESQRLRFHNGKIYDAKGDLFDTSKAISAFSGSAGMGPAKAIFVMDSSGNIYASNNHAKGKFHHSSFLAGRPVAAAGEILVRNGILLEVNRMSGHYRPDVNQLMQAASQLQSSGVDMSRVKLTSEVKQ